MAEPVHYAYLDLLHTRVKIHLIGAGGNGSQMLTGLARLDAALRGVGHSGLQVSVWDGDRVSGANVGRQMFYAADVGLYKSVVLVDRVNACFGLTWEAYPLYRTEQFESHWDGKGPLHRNFCDILISCTDTLSSRVQIQQRSAGCHYWLDLGNRQRDGQVILGQFEATTRVYERRGVLTRTPQPRLPHLFDLYPDLLTAQDEEEEPSCSMAEALGRQDLFINDHVTRWGLHLLWTLLRYGKILHHGYFVNLESGSVSALPVPVMKKRRR